jgi:hypothetical protein
MCRTNTKKRAKWKTLGGSFTTNYEPLLDFKFPEISTIKVVTWQYHVDDKTSSKELAHSKETSVNAHCVYNATRIITRPKDVIGIFQDQIYHKM